jgi:hypothetical protein
MPSLFQAQAVHGSRYTAADTALSDQHRQILDGLIISDAGVYAGSVTATPRFVMPTIHQEFASHITKVLPLCFHVNPKPARTGIWNGRPFDHKTAYYIRSLADNCLRSFRDRWYQNGIKIVPTGLRVDPLMLLYWFLGDGYSSSIKAGGRIKMGLCTDSFSKPECEFLVDLLHQYDPRLRFNVGLHSLKTAFWRLTTKRRETVMAFYEHVRACPVQCFGYKWKTMPPDRNSYINLDSQRDPMVAMRQAGLSAVKIQQALATHGITASKNTVERRLRLWNAW